MPSLTKRDAPNEVPSGGKSCGQLMVQQGGQSLLNTSSSLFKNPHVLRTDEALPPEHLQLQSSIAVRDYETLNNEEIK